MAQTPVLFIFQLWARAGSWVANSVPVLPRAGAIFLWADPLRGVPASGRHGAHVCARPKGDSGRVLLPLAGTGPLGRPFCSRGLSTPSFRKGLAMRTVWKIAPLAAALWVAPLEANAGKVEGVGIGAGVGAVRPAV